MPTTYDHIAANKRRSFFLIFLFVLIIVGLAWTFSEAFGGDSVGFVSMAIILALIMTVVGYFGGDRVALAVSGAHPITKEQLPYLYRMVENLAITAGVPMPKVYVIQDAAINAFATGRDPHHASVAVTTGAIEKLENEELEGVLAHEFSHVQNYDIRFMTLVAVLVGVIVLLADLFWRGHWLGFGGRRRGGNNAGGVLMLIGLVLIIFAPLFAQLIKLAVSRKREFLADASGALLTRYPDGLANALEKIGRAGAANKLVRTSDATAHLFIANPFGSVARGVHKLFSTHPPIEERVARLRQMGSVGK
ncbi:MAG: M48 family metallopeptidase [Candidatus Kerfeldbacteria bacterium]|nr:M48 family metallopeptidase [Candidatus Kerfeldbacteria bacterium]